MNALLETEKEIRREATRVSHDWFIKQCRNPFEKMYFYFKPGIQFFIGEVAPDETWTLGDNQFISSMWTENRLYSHLITITRRLPIL